jgi:hypothetical protein
MKPSPCGAFTSFSVLINRDLTRLLLSAANACPGVLLLSESFELAAVSIRHSEMVATG